MTIMYHDIQEMQLYIISQNGCKVIDRDMNLTIKIDKISEKIYKIRCKQEPLNKNRDRGSKIKTAK